MPISDLLPGRTGPAGRLPGQIEDMAGPTKGVVMLPMHLAWPGMRECDISDDSGRRSMYCLLLSQGKRNDIVRFVNATLLMADWELIADSLEPKLRRLCERQFGLGPGQPAAEQAPGRTSEQAPGRTIQPAEISQDGAIA